METQIKDWFSAFRLRTLPLAFSCILTGSALAYYHFSFHLTTFILCILTTLFLQVLSNLANDYGDSIHGADNEERIGPSRAIQSNRISQSAMKKAIVIFVLLSLITGVPLVIESTKALNIKWLILFLTLGIASIIAAIKYTSGKNPYGYKGLGDLFVFIFFGIIGVTGTFLLQMKIFNTDLLSPVLLLSMTIGLLAVAVLNLNNLRDQVNDKKVGKNTIVVKLGHHKAKIYHLLLISLAVASFNASLFLLYFNPMQIAICNSPFVIILLHILKVLKVSDPKDYDPELKKVALSTFLLSLVLLITIITFF